LSHQQQVEQFAAATRDYASSDEVKRLWRELFTAVGLDAAQTLRDRLHLRFQPHQPPDQAVVRTRATATVSFHRDSWGTNLYAQVNWWAPIYPITAGRPFAFYPALFARPVANSSAEFDLADIMRRNREAPATVRAGEMVP